MGLSTHVLDTMHGCPAAGMTAALWRVQDGQAGLIKQFTLDAAGRNPAGLLLGQGELQRGQYRLSFDVAAYFRSKGVALAEPSFLQVVNLDFGVAEPDQHYHVPLLVSPWSYSTYRGA